MGCSESISRWFGSRVDLVSGGVFYSSATQADPVDYPPHIEATSKYVNVLKWSGQLGRLPGPAREKLVDFIRAKQVGPPAFPEDHPDSGYFMDAAYPDLDPNDRTGARRDYAMGRALGFSVQLLELLGSGPLFPVPTSRKTAPAAHLESPEAFREWLEGRRWERTWTAGGDILSQAPAIGLIQDGALKKGILDAAFRYLETEQQNTETGYWGDHGSAVNGGDYMLMNGAHKITAFYHYFGRPVPHASRLAESLLTDVSDGEVIHICYVYNAARFMENLLEEPGVEVSGEELARFIRKEAGDLAKFRQDDGGFSTVLAGSGKNRFSPATKVATSNTDAGGLALSTRNILWELAGETPPPLPSAEDPRLFSRF